MKTEATDKLSTHNNPIIDIENLQFSWPGNSGTTLDIDQFQVHDGELLFVMGPSGSGKSTLLSILTGILTPQKGTVRVLEQEMTALKGAARDRFRADNIGYVFQMFNLIPYLSVVENVTLPCQFSVVRTKEALVQSATLEEEAVRLLEHLNLSDPDLISRPVIELSVGQQQRVAAARALIGSPRLVIADEPTSALDTDHREAFLQLVFEECKRGGSTLVFVSHDTGLASLFDRHVELNRLNRVSKQGGQG